MPGIARVRAPSEQLLELHSAAANRARLAHIEPFEDAAEVEMVATLALNLRVLYSGAGSTMSALSTSWHANTKYTLQRVQQV